MKELTLKKETASIPRVTPFSVAGFGSAEWLVAAFFVAGGLASVTLVILQATEGAQIAALLGLPAEIGRFIQAGAKVFLNPVFYLGVAVVFALEQLVPVNPRQATFSVGMIHDFAAWFTIDGFLRTATVPIYLGLIKAFYDGYLGFLTFDFTLSWSWTTKAAVAFVVADFLNWLHHLIRHKVIVFWYFHMIHHSQKEMNLFTDLRVHGVERLITKPIVFLPLFALQLDGMTVVGLVLAQEWYSRAYHANIRSNYGFLKYFMVTPQSHRIHHSVEPRHRDKNFGVVFSIWDRLFGTLYANYDEYPETGVDDPRFPMEDRATLVGILQAYWRQLVFPFRLIFSRPGAILGYESSN